MNKYTNGPWKFGGSGSMAVYSKSTGKEICTVNASPVMFDGEATSNAKLIAAAPELLEACAQAAQLFHDSSENNICFEHRPCIFCQAIAKATGQA